MEALFRDLLIGVTSFFRDPEAFAALETMVIPRLFADKTVGTAVRVWICGCSTGEEAYSIAILLQEQMDRLQKQYKLQLFATDIDSRAIDQARSGLYPPARTPGFIHATNAYIKVMPQWPWCRFGTRRGLLA